MIRSLHVLMLLVCLASAAGATPMTLDGLVPADGLTRQGKLLEGPPPPADAAAALWGRVEGAGDPVDRLLAMVALSRLPAPPSRERALRLMEDPKTDHRIRRGLARLLCAWDDPRGAAFFSRALADARDDDERLLILGDLCFVPRSVALRRVLQDFSEDERRDEKLRQAAHRLAQTRLQSGATRPGPGRWGTGLVVFAVFLLLALVEFRRSAKDEDEPRDAPEPDDEAETAPEGEAEAETDEERR